MNYFGHAAVASWTTSVPRVLLGAMLPDLATMCAARLAAADAQPDPDLARGIALHEATDAAFHKLPAATALMRELDDRLDRAGCARGPRRAVAHVGTELLLDGVYIDDADGVQDKTKTTVTCLPKTVTEPGSTTCTVKVADSTLPSNTPTGTVTLTSSKAGSFTGGPTYTLSAGNCSVTFVPSATGKVTITATYPASSAWLGSSAKAKITVKT